jgi:hypothetical protein
MIEVSETQSEEQHVNDMLAAAIAAHGGLDRWNTFNSNIQHELCGSR